MREESRRMRRPQSRIKIIAIGYNFHGTGLTRVMHNVMRRLADRYEIHYLGIAYSGEIIRERGLTIYPTNPKGGDVFAAFQAERLIQEIEPEVVFIMNDIWFFYHYLKIIGPYRDKLKVVAYIPLDGRIINEEDAAPLEQSDRVAVYTEFARKEFEGAFERLREKRVGGEFPPVNVIPHGIDLGRFYPFPKLLEAHFASSARAPAKRRVFADLPDVEDSFIVLNASRPDKRKRVDITIEGFAKFAADKRSNVKLCLHHAIITEEQKDETLRLVGELGLRERLYLNPLPGGVVDDQELNLLYNACDVGINTSMGEGWGLVSFEHGAAGAAQIVPSHTACAELWTGRAEMIKPARSYIPDSSVLEMGEVSAEGVAQALNNLYGDAERRHKLSQAAFEAARSPEYSWDAIMERFDNLFVELAG